MLSESAAQLLCRPVLFFSGVLAFSCFPWYSYRYFPLPETKSFSLYLFLSAGLALVTSIALVADKDGKKNKFGRWTLTANANQTQWRFPHTGKEAADPTFNYHHINVSSFISQKETTQDVSWPSKVKIKY